MFRADHTSEAASARSVSSRGLNMKHSKARPAGSENSTRTTVWKPWASHSRRQRLELRWSDLAMYCQATSGASESRQGAPKSRLSASACAASATSGRMHGHHLPVLAAAERVRPQHRDGLHRKLAQCADPVAEEAVQAHTVKVNRYPHGLVFSYLMGL